MKSPLELAQHTWLTVLIVGDNWQNTRSGIAPVIESEVLNVWPASGGNGGRRRQHTNNFAQRNAQRLILQLSTLFLNLWSGGWMRIAFFQHVFCGWPWAYWIFPVIAVSLLFTSGPRKNQKCSKAAAGTTLEAKQAQRIGRKFLTGDPLQPWEGPSAESRSPVRGLRAESQLKTQAVGEHKAGLRSRLGLITRQRQFFRS